MNFYRYDIQMLECKVCVVWCYIVCLNVNSLVGGYIGVDFLQVELLIVFYFCVFNVVLDWFDDLQCDIYIQLKGYVVGCYYCVLVEVGFFLVEWLEIYQYVNFYFFGYLVW